MRSCGEYARLSMPRLIALLFAVLGLLAPPTVASAQGKMVAWNSDHRLPGRLGPFRLFWSAMPAKGDDDGYAVLHVRDARGRKADVKSEIAFSGVYASLGVGRIDPESPEPQLLLTSYTGGAHCCVHIQLLDLVEGRWRTVDVGTFDGEPFSSFPSDIDGDGITDIDNSDDRFAYAFGCYACSWMPPRVFNVRGGKSQDVSAAARYRPLYAKDYDDATAQCLKHDNPACAAMVADGYRLGRADQAWAVAMANFDPKADWVLPGCKVKAPVGKCPDGQAFRSDEFRPALEQFLAETGIAPTIR